MNLGGPSSNTSYIVNKELQFTKIFDQHRTLNQKQKFPTIMIKYPTLNLKPKELRIVIQLSSLLILR